MLYGDTSWKSRRNGWVIRRVAGGKAVQSFKSRWRGIAAFWGGFRGLQLKSAASSVLQFQIRRLFFGRRTFLPPQKGL